MATRDPNLIRAQGEAHRLNQRFGGRKPGALDFEDVAMALGVLVIPGGVSGASARLVRNSGEGRIRLNPNLRQEGPRRFAVGHELGHWILHEKNSQHFLCTAADMRDYYNSPLEIEANYFASELLLPTKILRPMMEKQEPDLKILGQWSALFRASLTATTLRFIRDTKFDCIAVSIKDGRVEWSWKRPDGRRVWLRPGQPIQAGSLACELHEGREAPDGMEEVEAGAWFSHLNFAVSGEVREQSIAMPQYNTIFSLLWIV